MTVMRVGVVGDGPGGRSFHTPFIDAAQGIELAGVVTRSPVRKAAAAGEWPNVPTYDSLGELVAAGVDAVTITTPPATRRELVLEALAAGVHVIADKPFAPTSEVGAELAKAAAAAGVMLNVFHNRRWDADLRTLGAVLDGGRLGELWRVHSRFDIDDPGSLEAGPHGGLLRDVGSHVVDQLLWMLGSVRSVTADLDWVDLPEGRRDAGFTIVLRHTSGVGVPRRVEQAQPDLGLRVPSLRQPRQLQRAWHRRPSSGHLRRPASGRRPRELGLRKRGPMGGPAHGVRSGEGPVRAGSLPRLLHTVRGRGAR
jgi:predicted dehydrogenase